VTTPTLGYSGASHFTRNAAAIVAIACAGIACAASTDDASGGYEPRTAPTFVNWETPQVSPMDKTPDGTKLLVCNTAAGLLEVFDLTGAIPVLVAEIPVGVDPVSVRARTNNEVWVVNHVSDSISIVNITSRNVSRTIRTLDEPCDVVFAGTPRRAFVSCSQVNTIQVFDPANPAAAVASIAIDGEDPRALAVSPDGNTVYAAIFESGNKSTILGGGITGNGTINFPPNVVSNAAGPYRGVNPPPNSGTAFVPAKRVGNSAAPGVGLIVKKNASNQWMDDNAHDWTSLVSGASSTSSGRVANWDLADRDLAVINTGTLAVSYATSLMNICMAVGVNPASGFPYVVGTDATNEIRFEPNVKGKFLRVDCAAVNPATLTSTVTDLNRHLTYSTSSVPLPERNKSIGDPRAIVWNAAGTKGYIAGMGSNNVIVISPDGARAGLSQYIDVQEGPTGLCIDESRSRLYVLSRFAGSVSVIDLASESVTATVPFFDPTPAPIRIGRRHLYNTHSTSGLGQIACASCHVDARMDRLAWDLGDPSGTVDATVSRNLGFGILGLEPNTTSPSFAPFHPMKGPMTTQTMQDIIGHEPHHWRGDRLGLESFAGAFVSLQGADSNLPAPAMQEFENFLATIYFPPNPWRNADNTLPTNLPLPGHYKTGRFGGAGTPLPNGNAVNGMALYTGSTGRRLDQNAFSCVQCHTLPTGMGPDGAFVGGTFVPTAVGPNGEHHLGLVSVDGSTNATIKVPQIRNAFEKAGCNFTKTSNNAGFGYLHDGSVDSLERFVAEGAFTVANDQEIADLVAFVFCITGGDLPQGSASTPATPPGPPSQETHTAVGQQTTLISAANPEAGQLNLINSFISMANSNKVGLIVKGVYNGERRGFAYIGSNQFQSDRSGFVISDTQLRAAASPGNELTYTVVFKGTETRLGIDRDLDGVLDGDPVPCIADFNGDGGVDGADLQAFFTTWETGDAAADVNQDGGVDGGDIATFIPVWEAGGC